MPTLLVAHEPASAARVRTALRADLAARGVSPESVDAVLLVASELVGNAIRHTVPSAAGKLTVGWQISAESAESALVWVSDPSLQQPVRRRVAADEPGGRGLTIVDALAAQWGTDENATGKRVWARVPLRRVPAPVRAVG